MGQRNMGVLLMLLSVPRLADPVKVRNSTIKGAEEEKAPRLESPKKVYSSVRA
jgi:hypothetical protein